MRKSVLTLVIPIVALSLALMGCSDDEKNFDPAEVTLTIKGYTTAKFNIFDLIFPKAHAAITSLTMCFTSVTFTITDVPDTDVLGNLVGEPVTVSLNEGDLNIPTAGITLETATMAQATYSDISVNLDAHCASGESLSLTNTNGSFNSADDITLAVEGSFSIDGDTTVTLDLQNIADVINDHNGVNLKSEIEAVAGTVSN